MTQCVGLAAKSAESQLERWTFERKTPGAKDVVVDIDFCGICHSDVHVCHDDWGGTMYPIVPGHEIVGRVRQVGEAVEKFQVGDRVGVGCMVDSCGQCEECRNGLEQYCVEGCTWTYNATGRDGEVTQGGYADHIVVPEAFVLAIPEGLDPAAAAPLLCAGITTYSPLRHWNVGPSSKVGIAGFGGLGHMGVKLASAMGAEVIALTRSMSKAPAARAAGAADVVDVADSARMAEYARSLDLIVSTIPASHSMGPYLDLLKRDATYVIVGAIEPMNQPFHSGALMGRRARIAASSIGSIAETQELLEMCAREDIVSDVRVIDVDGVDDAYGQMVEGDAGFRFVIDMSTLK